MSLSAQDYVKNTPYVSEDGGVTLGSKKTSVFLLDAKSGKLIYNYKLADSPSTLGVHSGDKFPVILKDDAEKLMGSTGLDLETVEQLLYVTRTDYTLQHHNSNGQISWNLAFAEFDAFFQLPAIENELGAKYRGHFKSPLPHLIRPIVLRIRDQSLTEYFPIFDRLVQGLPGGTRLSLPASSHYHPSVAVGHIPVAFGSIEDRQALALPPPETGNPLVLSLDNRDGGKANAKSLMAEIVGRFHLQYFSQFLPTLFSIISIIYLFFRKQPKVIEVTKENKVQAGLSKRKKSRKAGNNKDYGNNYKTKQILDENNTEYSNGILHTEGDERKSLLTFSNIVDGRVYGRRVGKLLVSNKEIAKGSNGTIVLEGIYDGRSVAVKRLVQTHHDVALKEIQNLIASDQHPNIVRWHGVEYDQDFVYLSLERCTCSLNDLIYVYSESFQSQIITSNRDSHLSNEYAVRLHSAMATNQDIDLWKANGHPTHQLLKLMRLVEFPSTNMSLLFSLFGLSKLKHCTLSSLFFDSSRMFKLTRCILQWITCDIFMSYKKYNIPRSLPRQPIIEGKLYTN